MRHKPRHTDQWVALVLQESAPVQGVGRTLRNRQNRRKCHRLMCIRIRQARRCSHKRRTRGQVDVLRQGTVYRLVHALDWRQCRSG